MRIRLSWLFVLGSAFASGQEVVPVVSTPATNVSAQASVVPETLLDRPLPPLGALMLQVEVAQKAAEAKQKDYIFRESSQTETLKSDGDVKKTESEQRDIFWLDGVVIRKLISKDGKELSSGEKKSEDERIDKEVAKAKERKAKAEGKGEPTDPDGHPEITVSRLLELGSFSNERRQVIHDRSTIVADFTGDPKAKTRNPAETAIHDMAGTVWIDEQDTALERIEGHFVNDFKIGGGLLVKVKKGTQFSLTNVKVNQEVWLPAKVLASGEARLFLLFGLDGRMAFTYSDYRKFGAKSTIRPGFAEAPAEADPSTKPQ